MPRLYSERIMLREYTREDLPYIRAWVNDPEVADNLSDVFLYPHTVYESEQFLQSVLEGSAGQKGFIIADIATGSYIGQIDLFKIDWKNRATEMGIVIGLKEHWGKGYGAEAILLLQYFVFDRLNLNRLQLEVHDYNERAYRCYLKCGFVEEGRLRQRNYFNGRYTDMIYMGILKSDYEARLGRVDGMRQQNGQLGSH